MTKKSLIFVLFVVVKDGNLKSIDLLVSQLALQKYKLLLNVNSLLLRKEQKSIYT